MNTKKNVEWTNLLIRTITCCASGATVKVNIAKEGP